MEQGETVVTEEANEGERRNTMLKNHIAVLQQELDEERAANVDAQSTQELESRAQAEELRHELSVAKTRIQTMELEQAGLAVVRQENDRLSKAVVTMRDEMNEHGASHGLETDSIRREMFSSRMQLEKTFRKTLQELDEKHHADAFRQMKGESKTALVDRARVEQELAVQSIGIESLTERFRRATEALKVLKTDKSILQEHMEAQTRKISALRQQLGKSGVENSALNEKLAAAHEGLRETEATRAKLAVQSEELGKSNGERADALAEAAELRKCVQRLTTQVKALQASATARRQSIASNDALLNAMAGDVAPRRRRTNKVEDRGGAAKKSSIFNNLRRSRARSLSRSRPEVLAEEEGEARLQPSSSTPALRESPFAGILESWNSNFAKPHERNPDVY